MRIFVVADTHFGHKALSETLNVRPDDFENRLTNAWRATITEKDLVIHLGDVVVGKSHHWFDQLAPLPGRKILVQGNHDSKSYTWYMNNGFDFVCHCCNWKKMLNTSSMAGQINALKNRGSARKKPH